MSSPKELYVIILNWNGERVIGPCLDSLRAARGVEFGIIVVDNASTDSSVEIVKREYPEVELIQNEQNLLFAEGNNEGLRRAMELGGNLCLLLNNDTEVDPDFLKPMIDVIRRHPDVGIVGPMILYHDDPARIWYGGGDFYPLIWIPRHSDIRKLKTETCGEGGDTGYVSGCALLVKREVIEKTGMLDPSYMIYCEDVDFCLRAQGAGCRCYYEPAAIIWHKVSASSGGGFTPFKLENRIVSTFLLFKRFKPAWWRVLSFPLHACGFLLLLAALLLSGRWELLRAALRGAMRVARGAWRGV
jgi:GT2 family glycosyltransferase